MIDLGFSFQLDGAIIIFYRYGKKIKQIKGVECLKFIEFTETHYAEKIQIQIAKLTGNYKRGTERKARGHPRNKD